MKDKEKEDTNLIIKNLCIQIKTTSALLRMATSSEALKQKSEYELKNLTAKAENLLNRIEKHNTVTKSICEPK